MIKAGTTSYLELIYVTDDAGNPKTGLAYNTPGLSAYYVRNNGTATPITLGAVSPGNWISGGFVAVDNTNMPGIYQIGVPNAALATGASSVVIQFKGVEDCVFTPLRIELYTELDVNTIKVSGTTQTARDLGAGVLVADKTGFSLSGASVQAIWEYTTRVLTAGTNIGFPDASSIAAAVWSATSRTLSSFGSIVTDIAAAVWSAAVRTITGGNKDATIDSIAAKTANIPASPAQAGEYNTVLGEIYGVAGSAASNAGIAAGFSETAAVNTATILAQVIEVLNHIDADWYIDTATTPWTMVVTKKGDPTTVYCRKALKDIAGGNISSVSTVIASQSEVA